MRPQEGLFHAPGDFSALAVWRLSRMSATFQVREAASHVHAQLLATGDVHAVLAFEASLVSPLFEGEQGAPLLPRRGAHARIPSTQAHVLLQLSAGTHERLLGALRHAAALFAGVLVPEEEVLGGRPGDGPGPFGLHDASPAPTPDEVWRQAIVPAGPLAGAAWVLYLRLQRDLALEVGDASPRVAARVRARDTEPLLRRGFTFRQGHEEGLAFLAASSDPARFRRALDALLDVDGGPPDALLRRASAAGGGLYLAPPRDWFSDVHHRDTREAAP